MTMDKTETRKYIKDVVNNLISTELTYANSRFGVNFHNMHEAYSVIREEVEEADIDISELHIDFNTLWKCVKGDDDEMKLLYLILGKKQAFDAIIELIQVCAMFTKAIDSQELIMGEEAMKKFIAIYEKTDLFKHPAIELMSRLSTQLSTENQSTTRQQPVNEPTNTHTHNPTNQPETEE